jgi:chaperone required for assembly of F1-ATPase
MNGRLSRSEVYTEVFKYLSTDTLLFWNDESSPFREWQNEVWSKALTKFCQSLNLPQFQVTVGLFQLQQDDRISQELEIFLENLSAYELAGNKINEV